MGTGFPFFVPSSWTQSLQLCKSKNGTISLFGLTATASFDVLSDVERELSGNNSFTLDPDTIVRYENSNRLELQYKVEKIEVEYKKISSMIKKDD